MLALPLALAALFTLALVPPVRGAALRMGVVDRPDQRKHHPGAIPYLGGLAVVVAVAGAFLLQLFLPAGPGPESAGMVLVVLAAAALLCAVGAVDDFRPLPARLKFVLEVLLAGAVVQALLPLGGLSLGPWSTGPLPHALELLLGTFWVVAITNAYNMVDGLDGLAAGVGAVAAGALALLAALGGHAAAGFLLAALAGSLWAFLAFNAAPARIFLGDAGSLPVGFLLGALSLVALTGTGGWSPIPAALALAVPAWDLAISVIRRFARSVRLARGGRLRERFELRVDGPPALFSADRGHLHHRLARVMGGTRPAVLVLVGVGGVAGLLALWSHLDPRLAPAILLVAILLSVPLIARFLHPELRILERGLLLPLFHLPLVHRRLFHAAYDAVVFGAGLGLALVVTAEGALVQAGLDPVRLAVVAAIGPLVFLAAGVYQVRLRAAGLGEVTLLVGAAMAAVGVALLVDASLLGNPPAAAVAVLFLYFALTGTVTARVAYPLLDRAYQGRNGRGRGALIYGAGRGGKLALSRMLADRLMGLHPLGFVDDDPDLADRTVEGYPVFSTAEGLLPALVRADPEVVVVSTRQLSTAVLEQLSGCCAILGIELVHLHQATARNGMPPVGSGARVPAPAFGPGPVGSGGRRHQNGRERPRPRPGTPVGLDPRPGRSAGRDHQADKPVGPARGAEAP